MSYIHSVMVALEETTAEGSDMTPAEEGILTTIFNALTSPLAIVIYISVLVVLMLAIVISVMVNEHRFTSVSDRLGKSADKAERALQKGQTSRFDALKTLDEKKKTRVETNFNQEMGLKELCDTFRNFACGKLGLYYNIDVIREFIAGLAVSHIIILQGMSGTGKTSLAFAFGQFLENPSTVIPVQPMWKERSDLLGYYNEFTKRFNETLLLQKIYEANSRKDIFVTILDEMNIARVEYYFAEFLSLLEIPNISERKLEVVSDHWPDDPVDLIGGRVLLPDNMWFLGTANNDDSTFAISDKVYDRAMVLNIDTKSEPFAAPNYRTVPISAKRFQQLAAEAVKTIGVEEELMEKLKKVDAYLSENYRISFGNRIMKQITTYLPVYQACGGEQLDALDDILAKKILRKLETQNMTYRATDLKLLCDFFNDEFGAERMSRSLSTVRRIARNG